MTKTNKMLIALKLQGIGMILDDVNMRKVKPYIDEIERIIKEEPTEED